MAEEVENTTPDPIPQEVPAAPEPAAATPAPDAPAPEAPATEAAPAKPVVDLSKLEQRSRENRGPRPDRGNTARPDFRGPKLEAPPARERPDGRGPRPEGNRGPRSDGRPSGGEIGRAHV